MKDLIAPYNWRVELEKMETDSIGQDIILIDNPDVSTMNNKPFKLDITAAIICTNGIVKGSFNLNRFEAKAPFLFVVLPDQILQHEYVSEDFSGHLMIVSKQFSSPKKRPVRFSGGTK